MKNGKPKSEAPESAKAKKHESSGLKELAKRCLQFLWLDFIRNVRSTKFWIEVAALTGAFLYAGIAYEQWQAQLHGLRVDQRAWISVPSPTSYPLNGSFIPVSTQMTNTGKTPARIVEGDPPCQDL